MEIKLADVSLIEEFKLPEYTEIPDVGLYLKQVVKYINDSVGKYFGFTVTDSMLSNYVKMHIVKNPIKKAYYREHIAAFIFVSMAKSVLSLEDIDWVFKVQQASYSPESSYKWFKSRFERTLKKVFLQKLDARRHNRENDEQALLNSIVYTMAYKFYLVCCIKHNAIPEPVEPKKEKKEKKVKE